MCMLRSLRDDTKKCDTHLYTSFFHSFLYTSFFHSNQAKAVGELSTQHVREKTSDVSQQGGELLKAWLALTILKQYQNQYVVKVLNAGKR